MFSFDGKKTRGQKPYESVSLSCIPNVINPKKLIEGYIYWEVKIHIKRFRVPVPRYRD
jgi:hypothetical protein